METLAKTINPIIWEKAQSYAQENGIDLLNYIEKSRKYPTFYEFIMI